MTASQGWTAVAPGGVVVVVLAGLAVNGAGVLGSRGEGLDGYLVSHWTGR